MDALSTILALLDMRSATTNSLQVGGEWAIQFTPLAGIKFNAVAEGACWLEIEGVPAPVRLQAGDCFLLTGGRRFALASDLQLPRADAAQVFAHAIEGVAHHGVGTDTVLVGGRFLLDAADASMLIDALPPFVHIDAATPQAAMLRWVLDNFSTELASERPGAGLVAEHLSHIMLVQVLRAFLDSDARPTTGWLAALSDRRMGQAIRLMHEAPARRWTVEALAQAVGVSRSAFALRFKKTVGTSPLDYLLQWRMRLAKKALRSGTASVSSIGLSLGYTSESAFSSTFKRVTGRAPLQYRREENGG
jgi:AraC-like DNA-binding protein